MPLQRRNYYNDIYFSIQAVNQKGKKNTSIELDQRSSISPPATFLPVAYQYQNENPVSTIKQLVDENKELITHIDFIIFFHTH